MDMAFEYIKKSGGLVSETDYPYKGQEEGECMLDSTMKREANVTGHVDVPSGQEEELTKAIAKNGPVSVAIDASQSSFQFYKDGIYDEPQCDPANLDHGVLAVGYGEDAGMGYFIVKNSWGPTWGDKGYVKMTRNGQNQCGIATAASYPLV